MGVSEVPGPLQMSNIYTVFVLSGGWFLGQEIALKTAMKKLVVSTKYGLLYKTKSGAWVSSEKKSFGKRTTPKRVSLRGHGSNLRKDMQ